MEVKFKNIEELKLFIGNYEKKNFCQLYMRDSKTLDNTKKTKPNRITQANCELKYYAIVYGCVKGGRNFKSLSVGKRKSSTLKDGCQFKLRFSLSEGGQFLVLTETNEEHNHETSEEMFLHLPKQRRVLPDQKPQIQTVLELKCNKKLLQQYISNKTGKIITLKDLSNIRYSLLKNCPKNNLQEAVQSLKSEIGTSVEVLADEHNELIGIYYQNKDMKRFYFSYPELILCDATYKLNNLRMPLYIIIIIDGNGKSEIVATFLLANETEEAISKMIQIFKKENPCWQKTTTLFTDKDFTERKVFAKEFPGINTLLCLFHVLKSFRTTITVDSMNINSRQRQLCLEVLQKMAYSKNEDEYIKHYTSLLDLNLHKVIKYFNENWHDIRSEWMQGLKKQLLTFNTSTTNALENINQKIKQVCSKFSDLNTFYKELRTTFHVMRSEKEHKVFMTFAKNAITKFTKDSNEDKYAKLVTPYALNFIIGQIISSEKVKLAETEEQGKFLVNETNHPLTVTVDECQCNFRVNMRLPCKHIFSARRTQNIPLFSEYLVHEKFTRKHYFDTHLMRVPKETSNFYSSSGEDINVSVIETTKTRGADNS